MTKCSPSVTLRVSVTTMTDMTQPAENSPRVLVVGAGINGAAVARELALNGVSVVVVEANDIACGATSRSSRLIHGGLRYLERGDLGLVRESLREREILLQTAPDFVKPLRLRIPVRHRFGGLVWSGLTYFGWDDSWLGKLWLSQFPNARERGLWLIRVALWLYDRLAQSGTGTLACRALQDEQERPSYGVVPNATSCRWLCEYTDAQILSPERFTVALLRDARQLANENGRSFELFTHTLAELDRDAVRLIDRLGRNPPVTIRPHMIINATGAWGDATLADWRVQSAPLFGGTKGSHIVTANSELRAALGDGGLYAEASDGRMIFVLPFGSTQTLVGTTDEPFRDRPETAVADPREVDYLINLVNTVLPTIRLIRTDVVMSYSGVRPLPFSCSGSTSSIPRGHWIAENRRGPIPILTLIGGKLTTCRALAEEVGDCVLAHLRLQRCATSRDRDVLEVRDIDPQSPLGGSESTVRAVIRDEWVRSLSDLVERRLMLIFNPHLDDGCLRQLAEWLAEDGIIPPDQIESEVSKTVARLHHVYGISVGSGSLTT